MTRDEVARAIELAFAHATMPQTEDELAPLSIEAPYAIEHFFGKTRDAVESASFPASLYMEDFSYMTDAAVMYYVPSVLRIMLADPTDDELWIYLHGFLRHINAEYPYPGLRALDAAQRNAIADWAEHLRGEWASNDWMRRFDGEAASLARTYRAR